MEEMEKIRSKIIGAKIAEIRRMTPTEENTLYRGCDHTSTPYMIILSTGVEINAQQDEENNGPGVFAFFDPKTGTEARDWDLVRKE